MLTSCLLLHRPLRCSPLQLVSVAERSVGPAFLGLADGLWSTSIHFAAGRGLARWVSRETMPRAHRGGWGDRWPMVNGWRGSLPSPPPEGREGHIEGQWTQRGICREVFVRYADCIVRVWKLCDSIDMNPPSTRPTQPKLAQGARFPTGCHEKNSERSRQMQDYVQGQLLKSSFGLNGMRSA